MKFKEGDTIRAKFDVIDGFSVCPQPVRKGDIGTVAERSYGYYFIPEDGMTQMTWITLSKNSIEWAFELVKTDNQLKAEALRKQAQALLDNAIELEATV